MLRTKLRRCATSYPDKPAFHQGERSITWSAIYRRALRLAAALQALGVRKGDTVAILSKEAIEVYEHMFACLIIGAVRVGVNWRYAPLEMAHVLGNSNVRWCLVDVACIDLLARILDEEPVRRCTLIGIGPGHGLPLDYETLIAAAETAPHEPDIDPEEPLLHTYTSGVTGRPKAVVLSHRALEAEVMVMQGYFGLGANEIWYTPVQSAWAAIIANLFGLASGMTSVIPDGAFEITQYLRDIARRRVTVTMMVPAVMMRAVKESGRYDLSSLRRVVYGSAPATPALIRSIYSTLGEIDLVQSYGMTECSGFNCFLQPEDHRRALSTDVGLLRAVGRFGTHVDWRICDDEGREVERGESGTIWMRGETVMSGYFNLPEETREALRPGGWYVTNDIARVDENSYVYLLDRRKFLINSGGVNVFPAQVEAALADNPHIDELMVVGVPHPEWGEAVVAAVNPKPGVSDEQVRASILEACSLRLSRLEAPKHIEILRELPRTVTGKPDKKRLIAYFRTEVALPWGPVQEEA
jgi:acyl-CoA synthetase (AMP-forming)/AMP-acid ligase II